MDGQTTSTDDVLTVNTTRNSSSTVDTNYSVPINCGILVLSTCSILCNSLALNIMHKCRKTPYQIRFMSYNLLTAYILFESTISLHSIAMLFVGDVYYQQIFDSRIFFSCALVATLWGSICAITFERLVALTIPLHYNRHVTKATLAVSIASLWILTVLAPLLAFIIAGVQVCGQHSYASCNIYAVFKPARIVLTSFLLLFALIISISYIKILLIIFHHHKLGRTLSTNTKYLAEVAQKQKCSDSTKSVAVVILAFIVFQSPVFIHNILLNITPAFWEQNWRVLFQIIDYIGHQLNTYATLYLYIYKFKECKMNLFFILAKFSKTFKGKADSLRVEVFDIVLTENKHGKMTTMGDTI